MPRVYKVPLSLDVTTDADQDIFVIAAPADRKVVLHAISLTSEYTTDERAELELVFRSTAGSGGSAATEVKVDQDNALAAEAAVTTLVTTPGTPVATPMTWKWSQQNEFLYLPTPEIREASTVSGGAAGYIALHLAAALGGTRSWGGWVAWEEV